MTVSQDQSSSLLDMLLTERVIVFHPRMAEVLGGIPEAVFVQQLLYWTKRSDDGWVFRKQDELQSDTTLSIDAQQRVRAVLTGLGVLVEDRRKGNRLWYRIDRQVLYGLMVGSESAPPVSGPDGSQTLLNPLTNPKELTPPCSPPVNPRTPTEISLVETADKNGWTIVRVPHLMGLPDFQCTDEFGMFWVTCRPRIEDGSRTKKLRGSKYAALLERHREGDRCYVYDGMVLLEFEPDSPTTGTNTQVPDDFAPVDRTRELVLAYPLIQPGDVEREIPKFVAHHQAKKTTFKDWQAAFRKWMLNVSDWKVEKNGGSDNVIATSKFVTTVTGRESVEARRFRDRSGR